MKYLELINQTEEQLDQQSNELVNEEASLSLQSAMLNVKKELSIAERTLGNYKRAIPINYKLILEQLDTIDLLNRRQKQYIKLQKELF